MDINSTLGLGQLEVVRVAEVEFLLIAAVPCVVYLQGVFLYGDCDSWSSICLSSAGV